LKKAVFGPPFLFVAQNIIYLHGAEGTDVLAGIDEPVAR
jgi:hypothetical protein